MHAYGRFIYYFIFVCYVRIGYIYFIMSWGGSTRFRDIQILSGRLACFYKLPEVRMEGLNAKRKLRSLISSYLGDLHASIFNYSVWGEPIRFRNIQIFSERGVLHAFKNFQKIGWWVCTLTLMIFMIWIILHV